MSMNDTNMNDTDKHINYAWQYYVNTTYDGITINKKQYEELEIAFYAGTHSTILMIKNFCSAMNALSMLGQPAEEIRRLTKEFMETLETESTDFIKSKIERN